MTRKPTRRDLLVVIGRLQNLIGVARMNYEDDRNQNGIEHGRAAAAEAHSLCIGALSQDPPVDVTRGPWAARELLQRRLRK
jgi:hypothetical protein